MAAPTALVFAVPALATHLAANLGPDSTIDASTAVTVIAAATVIAVVATATSLENLSASYAIQTLS